MNPALLKKHRVDNLKKSGVNLRIKKIYARLEKEGLEGLIVSLPSNISYLTKFASHDSYLIVSQKKNIYFTDSRYIEEAKAGLKKTFTLTKINGSVFKLIADTCLGLGLRYIGFEERYLPFAEYKKIKEGLRKKTDLIPTHGLIDELREIKDREELEKIKKAIRITALALKFMESFISPGKKEIELVAELERFIRYHGASNSAFDIIVASGENSSFPHHTPGARKIKNNESVLVDIGVDYQGYKSDLTRIFFLGKINAYARKIYDIVLEAQDRAIKKVKPGCLINKVDAAARQYITRKGYGGFFGHNLGHSIGLDIHEEPSISAKETARLKPGMVFTVEPAIYLPHKFGVRIEDMVLVTRKGCEVLSGAVDK